MAAEAVGKKAVQAFMAARSVRITGHIVGAGPSGETRPTSLPPPELQTFDLRLGYTPGQGLIAEGWVATATTKVSVRRKANKIYLHGDPAYYARLGAQATTVTGRWLLWTVVEDRSASVLTSQNWLLQTLTNLDGLVDTLLAFTAETSGDSVTSSGVDKLGSADVTVLHARQFSGQKNTTMWVAATGKPLPLRYQAPESRFSVETLINFTDYGDGLSVTAPMDALDLNTVLKP